MSEYEAAMASRVRTWLAEKALKMPGAFQITVKDLEAPLATSYEQTKQISAALSKLAKQGHLKVIGRRNDRVSRKGTSRPFVYEVANPRELAKALNGIPPRRAPKPYERVVTHPPVHNGGQVALPLIGVVGDAGVRAHIGDTWFGDLNPNVAKTVVNDLIGVGVHIETNGLTRQSGLELLRLAERVFRGAK